MSVSQQYGRFNIYDIFSTFLPGAILLIGIVLPHPSTPSYIEKITFATLVISAIIAFALGLLLQSVAGEIVSGETSFDDRMSRVVESGREDNKVTAADVDFLETAREVFGFDADFDDWNHMYRAVLTRLEDNLPSRAIRLQALFLAMRGLVGALGILTLTTGLYTYLAFCGYIESHSPVILYGLSTALLFLTTPFTYRRADEFSEDVVSYMITEFRTLNPE